MAGKQQDMTKTKTECTPVSFWKANSIVRKFAREHD